MSISIGQGSITGFTSQAFYSGTFYFSTNPSNQSIVWGIGQFSNTISSADSTRTSSYKFENAPILIEQPYGYFVGAIGRIITSKGYLYTSF